MERQWKLKEQAERAEASFNEWPDWMKAVAYYAGSDKFSGPAERAADQMTKGSAEETSKKA